MASRFSLLLLLAGPPVYAAQPDMSLTMSAFPSRGKVGAPLSYTVKATNNGTKTARKLVVAVQLPLEPTQENMAAGCKFRGIKAQQSRTMTCKAKRLTPGQSTSWTIKVIPDEVTTLRASATVVKYRKFRKDPTPDNNTARISTQVTAAGNTPPTAFDVSAIRDPSVLNTQIELPLRAIDQDGDAISYFLLANQSDPGRYTSAYVNPKSGKLVVNLVPDFAGEIVLPYKATDGMDDSLNANATIMVQTQTDTALTKRPTGGLSIDPGLYATFGRSEYASTLFGTGGGSSLPPSVDLSPDFPVPGNQGQQNSCVAWAVAYSLKSYQEGVEVGWSLNARSHLFSPAFLYNQMNGGQDRGVRVHEALDFIITNGVATLDQAPYDETNYTSPPSQEAITQAANYKAVQRKIVSSIAEIKSALNNRRPVVVVYKVYDSLFYLKGTDATYHNPDVDTNELHTNVVVGYDDARGAFKLINSWGTYWGDKGYFWLPYDFAAKTIGQAYILEDGKNGGAPPDLSDEIPPGTPLADLQLQGWKLEGDNHIGGPGGKLSWGVVNAGEAAAPRGVSVSLMISKDQTLDPGDTYLVYELIPDTIEPGTRIERSRETNTEIPFLIPPTLEEGAYYFALWVDDMNLVPESDESNNINFSPLGAQRLDNYRVPEGKPDLAIARFGISGTSRSAMQLTYEIRNTGNAPAPSGWRIGLFANTEPTTDTFVYELWEDTFPQLMPVNGSATRDEFAPQIDLTKDIKGESVTPGTYYLALAVAPPFAESDTSNNRLMLNKNGTPACIAILAPQENCTGAQGGAKPNATNSAMVKVRIDATPEGRRSMTVLGETVAPVTQSAAIADTGIRNKVISSSDAAIFPVTKRKLMPAAK